jgi:choline dehydrogenase-like flavoprotein
MNNKTALVVAGQVVGGSSVVNGMFFDRGSRFDYDSWTEAGGKEFESSGIKWNWEGIFPYFKKVGVHEEARRRLDIQETTSSSPKPHVPQHGDFLTSLPSIAGRYLYGTICRNG